MSSEERGRASYLDLLVSTLMEHERNLNDLVEKLEELCSSLKEISKRFAEIVEIQEISASEKEKPHPPQQNTLIYMKLKGQKVEDLMRIIDSLKE